MPLAPSEWKRSLTKLNPINSVQHVHDMYGNLRANGAMGASDSMILTIQDMKMVNTHAMTTLFEGFSSLLLKLGACVAFT
jgi:hypothetical protein